MASPLRPVRAAVDRPSGRRRLAVCPAPAGAAAKAAGSAVGRKGGRGAARVLQAERRVLLHAEGSHGKVRCVFGFDHLCD